MIYFLRNVLAAALIALSGAALAVEPDEVLSDPSLEARARQISLGLRCVVCQNQSIDDSDAPLARDLRLLVRQRLTAGDSDEQALAFIVARYGDFVLLKPPFTLHTALLWFAPIILLLSGAYGLWRARKRATAPPEPLTADETLKLRELLNDGR